MPGLIRGVARTAVVAGTATAVSNRVSRRQGDRWARQEQQYAQPTYYAPPEQAPPPPPPSAPAGPDRLTALTQLGELKAQGVLTEAEFEREKAKILAS
jgi:hypothetical protein